MLQPIFYPVYTLEASNDAKQLDGCRTRINYVYAISKHSRNKIFEFFSVQSIFISLMNTKSGIFTRRFAFGVHSVK